MSPAVPSSMFVLETDRLRLRHLSPEGDAAFMLRLLNDASFIRNIGDRGVRSEEDATRYLADGPAASYARPGPAIEGPAKTDPARAVPSRADLGPTTPAPAVLARTVLARTVLARTVLAPTSRVRKVPVPSVRDRRVRAERVHDPCPRRP